MQLIGWTGAWTSPYKCEKLTEERRMALVGCMRKRRYNFTYDSHQLLPYATPLFIDNTICVLTRQEWDSIISDVYKDNPLGPRLMPEDVIERAPINGVIYEKEKWEPKNK